MYIDSFIGLDLNLVTRRQERVEPNNQIRMATKQCGNTVDNARGINPEKKKFMVTRRKNY